jgi:hypothetical protein
MLHTPFSDPLRYHEVLPHEPIRPWVLSFPFQLKFRFASRSELMGKALCIAHHAIASYLIKKALPHAVPAKNKVQRMHYQT